MGLGDAWNNFLAWSEEKGLPVSKFAYWLEDHGIPSLPAFIAFIAIIALLAFFFVTPGLGAGVLAPTGSVKVLAVGLDQKGIPGVNVSLTVGEKTFETTTNADGIAEFSDVPAGAGKIMLSSENYFFSNAFADVEVKAGATAQPDMPFVGAPFSANLVVLSVDIAGADNANIYLLDSSGVVIEKDYTFHRDFNVEPNKEYIVRAALAGYSPVERRVRMGSNNQQITLTLKKVGEVEMTRLHVGVFDAVGVEGNPVANASVKIVELASSKVIATLSTGEDGTVDATEIPIGSMLLVTASAPGFLAKTIKANASSETVNIKIRLEKATPAALEAILRVVDEAGNAVASPLVGFFDKTGLRQETTPIDGVAEFNATTLEGVYATVFKPGFLPALLKSLKRGENKVTLVTATDSNSGIVRVRVLDKNGFEVAQAFVSLLGEDKKFLGIPPRVTGPDGLQAFEGVPVRKAIAVAVLQSRVVYSEPFDVLSKTLAPEGIEVELRFPPAKARLDVVVIDSFSKKPVKGALATVFGEENASIGSCTTNALGKCRLELTEQIEAFARVSATGFEDFESAPFAIAPGYANKQEFALMPRAPGMGRMVFLGFYTLAGKKASELKPFTVYNARFQLKGSGAQFEKAIAHVRVNGLERGLEQEASELVAYTAVGARVTRGVAYEEFVAQPLAPSVPPQEAGERVVEIFDYGFMPADIEVEAGSRVVFKNVGNKSHQIIFDRPFEESGVVASSRVLKSNESYSVVIPKTGSFGFRCSLHPGEVGSVTALPKRVEEQARVARGGAEAGAGATSFKWIEFSFQPFQGTRDIIVQFKTKQRLGEKTWLEYRAAFYGKEGAVLREPADEEAGKTKPELLAATYKTPLAEIRFGGECGTEFCVNAFFEGEGTRARVGAGFEALLGKEFKLSFKALKGFPEPALLKLSTDSRALVLKQGVLGAGAQTQVFPATPSARTNQTEDEGAGAQEIVVSLKDVEASGFFTIDSRRLSKDSVLALTATDAKNNVLFEKQFFVRVISPTAPALKVSVKPASVVALQENVLLFKVVDAFNQPVTNARVALESGLLPERIVEAEASEGNVARGEYRVAVKPSGVGTLAYTIEAEGFRKKQGTIPVNPPSAIIEVEPAKLQLSIEKLGELAAARFTVTNKLSNELRVSILAAPNAAPKYTELALVPELFKLAGKETREVLLSASALESVLAIAAKPGSLRERVEGKIIVTTRLADGVVGTGVSGASETREIGFAVNTVIEQQSIDELWSVEKEALELELDAGKEKEKTEVVRVTNNGLYPLLINQEISFDDAEGAGAGASASVEPLSAVLGEGESIEFKVTTRVPAGECLMQEYRAQGTLSFYASFSGVSSKKTVKLSRVVSSSEVCKPRNGFEATLPLSISFFLPSGSLVKQNVDGSTSIRLPNTELLLLDSGASVSQTQATLPANTRVFIERSRGTRLPNGLELKMPLDLRVNLPSDAELLQQAGALVVKAGNAVITFPPGTQLSAGGIGFAGETEVGGRTAFVPANSPIRFQLAAFAELVSVIPPGAFELRLPTNALLFLPAGTRVVKPSVETPALPLPGALSSYAGVQGVRLPSGELFAFGAETTFSQAPLVASVPAESSLFTPPQYVQPLAASPTNPFELESFSVALPFAWSLIIPAGARSPTRDSKTGLYSIKLSEDAVLQFTFDPAPKPFAGGASKQVFVNAFTRVIFLKGARAAEFEDPTETSPCLQSFVASEDVILEFPSGTRFVVEGKRITAVLHECSDASKIRVVSKTTGDELYESAASKRVIVENGELQGDASDFVALHTITAPRNTRIVFKACQKVSDELKQITLTLVNPTTLVLPEGAQVTHGLTVIDFRGYRKIKLFDASGRSYELAVTNKIVLEFPASGPSEKEVAALQAKESREVVLPAKTRLKFIPYCDKASAGVLEVRSDANTLSFKPDSLSFELNNNKEKHTQSTCIQNIGQTSIAITSVEAIAQPGKDPKELIRKTLPADSEHMHFREEEKYGKAHTASIAPGEACANYDVTAIVPDDPRIKDQYGCIREGVEEQIEGKLLFHARDVDGNVLTPKGVSVKVSISGKGKCAPREAAKAAAELYAVKVSRAALYYKDVGHKLFVAIKNNWREDVGMRVENSKKIVECKEVGLNKNLEEIASIEAGSALVAECVSLQYGEGRFVLKFSAPNWEKEQVESIQVTVFKPPDNLKNLYSATPIGEVLVEDLEDLGITETKTQKTLKETEAKTLAESEGKCLWFKEEEKEEEKEERGEQEQQPQQPVFDKSFEYCEIHFCTLTQAVKAFNTFLASTANAVLQEAADEKGLLALYDYMENKKWVKSFALHLTNTRFSTTQLFKLFDEQVSAQSKQAQKEGIGGIVWTSEKSRADLEKQFAECGIYVITARLVYPLESLSKPFAEQRKDLVLEVDVSKKVACPQELANAALLMPPDNTQYVVGNRVVHWPAEALNAWKIFKLQLQPMTVGAYDREASERDVRVMKDFYAALYGLDAGKVPNAVKQSVYYEDFSLCLRNLGLPLTIMAGVEIGACIATLVGAVGTAGLGARFAYNFCQGAVKSLSGCGLIFVGGTIRGAAASRFRYCDELNYCVLFSYMQFAEAIAGLFFKMPFEELLPEARQPKLNIRDVWKASRVDVVTQGGLSLALGIASEKPNPAIAYFGGKILKFGWQTIQKTKAAYGVSNKYAEEFETKYADLLAKKTRFEQESSVIQQKLGTATPEEARKLLLEQEKLASVYSNYLTKSQNELAEILARGGFDKKTKVKPILKELEGVGFTSEQLRAIEYRYDVLNHVNKLARMKNPATQITGFFKRIPEERLPATEKQAVLETIKKWIEDEGGQAPWTAEVDFVAGAGAARASSSASTIFFAEENKFDAPSTPEELAREKPKTVKVGEILRTAAPVAALTVGPTIISKIWKKARKPKIAENKALTGNKMKLLNAKGLSFPSLKQFLVREITPAALVAFLLNVNGKPVRAELGGFVNYGLVFHDEVEWTVFASVPTMQEFCYLTREGKKESCVEPTSLEGICGRENDLCLIMSPQKIVAGTLQEQLGLQGYVVAVKVNNEKTAYKELFKSIFKPELPPLEVKKASSFKKAVGEYRQDFRQAKK